MYVNDRDTDSYVILATLLPNCLFYVRVYLRNLHLLASICVAHSYFEIRIPRKCVLCIQHQIEMTRGSLCKKQCHVNF